MNFLVFVQTIVAAIVIVIALWVIFHLIKSLIPYRKRVAVLLTLSVFGLVLYDQGYREYVARKNLNDNASTSNSSYTNSYFAKESVVPHSSKDIYDEEYIDDCNSLPQYCYQMASCSQAMRAFECGNYELDGDSDGVPCESLCGNY